MINTSHWFAFVEWCQTTPRRQAIQRLERLSEIEGHHHDCVSRCEHGKSISAGQAGHMTWCRSHKRPMMSTRRRCAEFVITLSEQNESKTLVFDTVHQRLRYLEEGEAYVAVSHVWGQRLFGQDTRTLGQCALSELKRLATYNGVVCVWLDSLCVPSSPEARRKCIDGMRFIYQDATCVAVYDEGIMVADRENELGFAFEVSISEWNSRVWTLQEGLLNKNVLYVQEKNYIPNKAERVHSFLSGIEPTQRLICFLTSRPEKWKWSRSIYSVWLQGEQPRMTLTMFVVLRLYYPSQLHALALTSTQRLWPWQKRLMLLISGYCVFSAHA